jgi:hypothetical protein
VKKQMLVIIGLAVLIALGVGTPVYLLWLLTGTLEREGLAVWAIVATLALPVAFLAGFWFGKIEVRGFLAGVDKSLDKLAAAVDLRDTSRIAVHNVTKAKPQVPSYNVILPGGG